MIGMQFFCPDATLRQMCMEAEYAREIGDFTVQLSAELKDHLLSAALALSSTSSRS